jgi:predicted HicB family RNase H-like nuclease
VPRPKNETPDPRTHGFNLRVTPEQRKLYSAAALKDGRSKQHWATRILDAAAAKALRS